MTSNETDTERAPSKPSTRLRRGIGVALSSVAAGVAVAGAVFVYSGRYNVAATDGHSRAAERVLRTTMVQSVRRHASGISVPSGVNLRDRAYATKFFGHYSAACASCHGAPGVAPDPWVVLYPPAPKLTVRTTVEQWSDAELFWIIKHGIKDTGMIALGPTHKDSDIWGVTAIVRQLPDMKPADYRAMRRDYEAMQAARSARQSDKGAAMRGRAEHTSANAVHEHQH